MKSGNASKEKTVVMEIGGLKVAVSENRKGKKKPSMTVRHCAEKYHSGGIALVFSFNFTFT